MDPIDELLAKNDAILRNAKFAQKKILRGPKNLSFTGKEQTPAEQWNEAEAQRVMRVERNFYAANYYSDDAKVRSKWPEHRVRVDLFDCDVSVIDDMKQSLHTLTDSFTIIWHPHKYTAHCTPGDNCREY